MIVEQGADEHSFQLRPSQAAALADAGVIFWVGEELTPWLARALETTSGTANTVALLDAPGVTLIEYGDGSGRMTTTNMPTTATRKQNRRSRA